MMCIPLFACHCKQKVTKLQKQPQTSLSSLSRSSCLGTHKKLNEQAIKERKKSMLVTGQIRDNFIFIFLV